MNIKRGTVALLAALSIGAAIPTAVEAATVYYKGTAVSWDHGRSLGVTSYSTAYWDCRG